ncbi:hypothetical protein LOTGIDRAFT_227917 [Lottia gigantea]|uniref:Uncharacterized protein n=1 Tax=Lottia gigantea TaxID=225164 RepID=V4BC71_LOTGI|nr:hypothetical protein LOTGIDRAFT_227917 [Lottia gigantea]ESP05256.1 hypothetical protein LOTGIDRAFT_227917 [Lottia gigantea]
MTDGESQPKGPVMGTMIFPMVKIPGLTDFTHGNLSGQRTLCSGMDMDLQRCLARVGLNKHLELCSKESEDFVECMSHSKQRERYEIMKAERERQKKAPLPPPPYDSLGAVLPQ